MFSSVYGATAVSYTHLDVYKRQFGDFTATNGGLYFVCSKPRSGKSTALASLIAKTNSQTSKHILWVSEGTEFLFEQSTSFVSQLEVNVPDGAKLSPIILETWSPDVIATDMPLHGEFVEWLLRAAETGAKVFVCCLLYTSTLSSCVAGLMEGRIYMEGAVKPGFLARFLSRFVDQKDIPFGGAAPMANPLSMQVLLEEIGSVRTTFAAVMGGVGKMLGQKGWFYVLAGEDAGQIDDVLGSLPPYDYYVIMGPKDPPGLAQAIADEIGCEAAIVDANDLGVAWAVGYSSGVDAPWLEDVMSTNPAGNQEQQTPIVLVRTLTHLEKEGT